MPDIIQSWLSDPTFRKLLFALAGVVLVWIAVRLVNRSIARVVRDSEVRYRTRKFVGFVGFLVAAMVFMSALSIDLRGVTVAFGVAGAGVAFALQEVIVSFAGWFVISFGGFYSTGDRVQLGGIKGDVIDIGVLRTTLMEVGEWIQADQYNGRVVRIANSFVFKEPVFNYSGDFPFLWDEIRIPVKYGSDRALARKILLESAHEITGSYVPMARKAWQTMTSRYVVEDATTEPLVTLVANDNWMEFNLRYVVDYKRRRTTKDLLYNRILDAIDGTEGRVALASMTVHIVETPPFNVRLERPGRS